MSDGAIGLVYLIAVIEMKITIVGAGYVGLSLAVVLAKKHVVLAVDIDDNKIDAINNGKIAEIFGDKFATSYDISNICATKDIHECHNSDYIIVATPTNYDNEKKCLDMSIVDEVIEKIRRTDDSATIVIKSTVPIGYTMSKFIDGANVLFSPEFLREGNPVEDILYPSRIIVGCPSDELFFAARKFANMMSEVALKDTDVMITGASEAESIKLFSNTYLASRIAFFNELDTFAEIKGLNATSIIKGVCCDPRIGKYYNNPSFGYGGYCLPKDSKQLLYDFGNIPNEIICATVKSNETRKDAMVSSIIKKLGGRKTVGVYRINMKRNSDDIRGSSVLPIIKELLNRKINVLIYEPLIKGDLMGVKVESDFDIFISSSDVVVVNRRDEMTDKLSPDLIYTRDIFYRD